MCKVLSDKHDWLMKRYFTRNQASVMGRERAIFAMDKNGFIMSVNLLIKVVPNLGSNLRIVGLMTTNSVEFDESKNDNLDIEHQILFHSTSGTVYGVSRGCFYEFGIRPDITDGRTRSSDVLNLSDIFPKLGDIAAAQKQSSQGGFELDLDTSKLPQRFYVDKTDFVKIGKPRLENQAYSVYRVKIEISESFNFDCEDLCLSVMRFRAVRGKQIQELGQLVQNFGGKKKSGMNDILKDFDGLDEEQEEELKKLLDKEKEMRQKENDDGN